ncbi:MAG: hypothetical protein WC677_03895 [Clostridia bacterium]|jgi:alpha-tubulin suppressor-like RCC1 family protein
MKKSFFIPLIACILLVSCSNSINIKTNPDYTPYVNEAPKISQGMGRVIYLNNKDELWNWGKFATDGEIVLKQSNVPLKIRNLKIHDLYFLRGSVDKKINDVLLLNDDMELLLMSINNFKLSIKKLPVADDIKRVFVATFDLFSKEQVVFCQKSDNSIWEITGLENVESSKSTIFKLPDGCGEVKDIGIYGTIICENGDVWQQDFFSPPNSTVSEDYRKIDISNVKDVQGRDNTFLAVKNDGTVWGWGVNNELISKDLSVHYPEKPVKIPGLDNITQISCSNHALALSENGEVYEWGIDDTTNIKLIKYSNSYAKIFEINQTKAERQKDMTDILGKMSSATHLQFPPHKIDLKLNSEIKYIYSGDCFSGLMTSGGELLCRGSNYCGQLGIGSEFDKIKFTEIKF